MPWKLALWGSHRDGRLLKSLNCKFESLAEYLARQHMTISEGLQLRVKRTTQDAVEPVPEVAGKPELQMSALRKRGRIHTFHKDALKQVEPARAYARKGRAVLPLAVCRPPHVIVAADRRFAVFSNKFIVVPPRQIGISGSVQQKEDLRLLALYLNSSFCQYHEFLVSPQGGIREGRSTLDALEQLPVPIPGLSPASARRGSTFTIGSQVGIRQELIRMLANSR